LSSDLWLECWIDEIVERVGKGELLEIGCGGGRDTAVLAAAGLRVLAIDRADLSEARSAVPEAEFKQIDLRDFLPTTQNKYAVIIASLSLHYFSWEETKRLFSDIHNALQPNGMLLFRVNSTKDINYGAQGYPEISKNFYKVGEKSKRFFDEGDLARLVGEKWRVLSQREMKINRYEQPKVIWELLLEKTGLPG